jgi:shikimate kinase
MADDTDARDVVNNTERDRTISELEARRDALYRQAAQTSDHGHKNELTARAGGIEEALQRFRPAAAIRRAV